MFRGCNNCVEVHGGIENLDWYDPSLINDASSSFCTGTPTADFLDIFGAVVTTVSAGTTASDLFPSNTAVSDYFTGALETNIGQITGSAAMATATGSSGSDSDSFPSLTSGGVTAQTGTITTTGSGSGTTSKTSGSSSSKTTSSAASSATGNAAADLMVVSEMLSVMAAGVGILFAL